MNCWRDDIKNNNLSKEAILKTLFRTLALIVCVSSVPVAQAQMTLDTNDVKANYQIGKVLTQNTDTIYTPVNVGTPSTTVANSWNFSHLRAHSSVSLTSISVVGAPGAGNFPGATHCMRGTVPFTATLPGIGTIIATANLHRYLKVAGDLIYVGDFGPATGTLNGSPIAGNLNTTNVPQEIYYKLPETIGTTWTTNPTAYVVIDVTSPIPIPGAYRDSTKHNMRYVVDAFGTMVLPGSSVQHQALRLRRVDRSKKNLDPERALLNFIFITKSGASVNFTVCDTTLTSGVVTPCGSTQWNGPMPTAVQSSEAAPSEFALKQNYPNPFNPTTTISYQIASEGLVSLHVYNMLGERVGTLVNEVKSPGEYSAEWNAEGMPSGVYFYKMEAGNFSATRRLLLLK